MIVSVIKNVGLGLGSLAMLAGQSVACMDLQEESSELAEVYIAPTSDSSANYGSVLVADTINGDVKAGPPPYVWSIIDRDSDDQFLIEFSRAARSTPARRSSNSPRPC